MLIELQADIGTAQVWGGGYVAAVDGMRFIVSLRTIHARPNPRYVGPNAAPPGSPWSTTMEMGTAGRVLSGTPRDSLHLIDLIYSQDGGPRPEVIITDAGSYSDLVWGLLRLLDLDYRPATGRPARSEAVAHRPGGGLRPARGRVDLHKIGQQWHDMLRVAVSVHTDAVSAYDVIRVLQHGTPTPLGEAITHYGRIVKTLHVLTFVDDEPHRRQIKGMRDLSEARQGVARHVFSFHGHTGQLCHRYQAGMEDQLGALGLALNCITRGTTVYLDLALDTLRAHGHPVLETMLVEISKLEVIRAIGLPAGLFDGIDARIIAGWRARAPVESPVHLREHPQPTKLALLCALLQPREREVTDALLSRVVTRECPSCIG